MAFSFTATSSGPATLRLESDLDDIEIGQLVLIPEGYRYSFDEYIERFTTSVYTPLADGTYVGPLPMRFMGDGRQGFAAILERSERMVLARSGLVAGVPFQLRLQASQTSGISCGLVDSAGTVVQRFACSSGALVSVTPAADAAAVFVEADADAPTIEIDDIGIATPTAPDGDGDGTPDAVDTCPQVANPTQELIPPTLTVPPDITVSACVAPSIGQATATTACGGSVTVVNDAPHRFPLGTTNVTWTAIDEFGNRVSAVQAVRAVLSDDASCCPAGSNVIMGTNASETIVGTEGPDCMIMLGGDDTVDARGGDDVVSGGSGRDTIFAGFGNDLVFGGPGQDVLNATPGVNTVDGGDDHDTCMQDPAFDTLVSCP